MPSSFDAMESETRPLALLDNDERMPARSPRHSARAVVWMRVAKASLIVGGGLVLLVVA